PEPVGARSAATGAPEAATVLAGPALQAGGDHLGGHQRPAGRRAGRRGRALRDRAGAVPGRAAAPASRNHREREGALGRDDRDPALGDRGVQEDCELLTAMASLRDIRRRIRGIRNTAQITKAMELVAASRMRRAQQRVLAARPYAETM